MTRFLWSIVAILALGGCAIHPLPEQVTRQSTLAIVTAIRCEAQSEILNLNTIYDTGAIGYIFDFDITEHNHAGIDLAFKRAFSAGSFELTLSDGNSDLRREAHRRFTMVDKFKDLRDADCSQTTLQSRFMYPIAGSIGMGEVIRTTVDIDLLAHGGLAPLDGGQKVGGQTAVFSDELTYTTVLDTGSLVPTLALNEVPGVFRLTKASASLKSDRTDQHKLILAIALPDPKVTHKASLRAAAKVAQATTGITHVRGIPSKVLIQGTADPRIRVLWELDRRVLLNQDDRLINALTIRR